MGMEGNGVCAAARFCADAILSRLLGKFLRWKALRDERRFAAHCRLHVAAFLPQLVRAPLPVCLSNVSWRGRENRNSQFRSRNVEPNRATTGVVGFCG